MSDLWRKFRSWPVWGQALTGLLIVVVVGAIFGGEEERGDIAPQTSQQTAEGDAPADGARDDAPSSSDELTCQPFSRRVAEELISNSDTGERKLEGKILATASLKSSARVDGRDLWFISINVAGTIVTLAHDVPPGEEASGPGLYYSLNSTSEAATSFPADPRGKISESTEGYRESVSCVE